MKEGKLLAEGAGVSVAEGVSSGAASVSAMDDPCSPSLPSSVASSDTLRSPARAMLLRCAMWTSLTIIVAR